MAATVTVELAKQVLAKIPKLEISSLYVGEVVGDTLNHTVTSVKPNCGSGKVGHWFCVSHQVNLRNPKEVLAHCAEQEPTHHSVVWFCGFHSCYEAPEGK